MKKVFCIFLFCVGSRTGFAQTTPDNDSTKLNRMVRFTNADYSMGRIPYGKPLEYNVTIRNISKDTLEIKEVRAGCGCTTPKYKTGEKILPGKSAVVVLGFNGGANGDFTKSAELFFTNGLSRVLTFHGTAYTDTTGKKEKMIINR
jgi:hypothetical protein